MKIVVRNITKTGRSLFAGQSIKKGEVIEIAHVVPIDKMEHDILVNTVLNLYVYSWKDNGCALALGLGSLFNHSNEANVEYSPKYHTKKIVYKASRSIKKGEQLFIDYGYDPILEVNEYNRRKEKLRENLK